MTFETHCSGSFTEDHAQINVVTASAASYYFLLENITNIFLESFRI
jgi:DNA-directed RNA polymerase alpha subunit